MTRVGYAATTVEMIRDGAGISRRTFYDHFADRDTVVLAYFDASTVQLLAAIDAAVAGETIAPPGQIDAGVVAALELVAEHPDAAGAWLTPAGRSHEQLADHRLEALAALERRLAAGLRAEGRRVPSAVGLELRVGAVCEVVRRRLLAREAPVVDLAQVLTSVLRQPVD